MKKVKKKKKQMMPQLKVKEILLDTKRKKAIKKRITKNLFRHEEDENYYMPLRVNNFWSNI